MNKYENLLVNFSWSINFELDAQIPCLKGELSG